jgi:hypothetical protein
MTVRTVTQSIITIAWSCKRSLLRRDDRGKGQDDKEKEGMIEEKRMIVEEAMIEACQVSPLILLLIPLRASRMNGERWLKRSLLRSSPPFHFLLLYPLRPAVLYARSTIGNA